MQRKAALDERISKKKKRKQAVIASYRENGEDDDDLELAQAFNTMAYQPGKFGSTDIGIESMLQKSNTGKQGKQVKFAVQQPTDEMEDIRSIN